MSRKEMIGEMVRNWERSANKASKWYDSDKADYIAHVSRLTDEQLSERFGNSVALNSEGFKRSIEREIGKLDRSGMFNVEKMKPSNMLD